MAKLIWTEESLDQLRRIGDYLSEHSPEAAATVTEGVWQKAQVLSDFPEIGWRHHEIENRNVRSILYGHYRIVYEIESADAIRILSVIHTSMEIKRFRF